MNHYDIWWWAQIPPKRFPPQDSVEKLELDIKSHKIETIDDSYDYLLNMPTRSMTKKRLDDLEKEVGKITEQIKSLEKMTEKQIWLNELDEFEQAYQTFLKTRIEEVAFTKNRKKKN